MGERYQEVYRLPHSMYSGECPLIIETAVLQKDNKENRILAQVKVRNIGEKDIIAYKISIKAYETSGKELEGIQEFPFIDINLSYGIEGGSRTPIYLPKNTTRSIDISVTEIVFHDKTVWISSAEKWEPIPEQTKLKDEIKDPEVVKQYSIEVSGNCLYYPRKEGELILCTCGAIISAKSRSCYKCKRNIDTILNSLDIEALEQKVGIRLEKEKKDQEERIKKEAKEREERAEKARLEKEEADRKEQERKKKQEKINKRNRTIGIVAVLAVIIAIVFYLYGIPQINLSKAEELYNGSKYDESLAILEKDGWRFVDESQITYMIAMNKSGLGQYQEAIDILKDISEYGDAKEKIQSISLEYVNSMIDNERYDAARTVLTELTDSDEVRAASIKLYYLKGKQELERHMYINACEDLEMCLDYEDAKVLYAEAKKEIEAVEANKRAEEEKKQNEELFERIQMEVFLTNFDEAEMLIQELPQEFIDGNSEVRGFIEKLPDADKTITGYWHSYSGDEKKYTQRENYGRFFGLVYVNGRFVYQMEYFDYESTFPEQERKQGIHYIKIGADWSFDGKTLKCNDPDDVLYGDTVFVYESATGNLKEIEKKRYREITTIYVR